MKIVITITNCRQKLLNQWIDTTQPDGFDRLYASISTVVPSADSIVYWYQSDTIKIFIPEDSDMMLPDEAALAIFGEVVDYDTSTI
jgi:hypothetical protein